MLRKTIIGQMILLTISSFVWAQAVPVTTRVYSIVTNPGEDCSTEMNIGWHADIGSTNCRVICTKQSDATWDHAFTIVGTYEKCDVFNNILSKTPSGADFNEDAVFLNYGATLTNLQRDTYYMYKICTDDGECSYVHYFRTAGGKDFTFIWIGDIHHYPPIPNRLTNAVNVLNVATGIAHNVDFILSTGDVVAWGGSYSFWRTLYEQDFIRDYVFAYVAGNHDVMTRQNFTSSEYFRVVNNVPRNGYVGQEGVCYWFLYNEVLFIMLNNEAMKIDSNALAAAQQWAGDVIKRLKGNYRHIFICEHYQWFDGRSGKASWYADWKDFCDEYGVAIALSGNNHIYERTYPLHNDLVVKAGKGTIYMEVPSSDGERGVRAGTLSQNKEKLAYTWSSQQASNGGQVRTIGCALVKVKGDKITTRLVHIDKHNAVQVSDEHTARMLTISPRK